MEVLPSSDVQYVGESDCTQQHTGTAVVYEKDFIGFDHGKQDQLADGQVGELLANAQGPRTERESGAHRLVDEFPISEGQCGASCSDSQLESQMLSDSHDLEDDDLNVQNYGTEPCRVSESAHIIVDTIENEQNSSRDGESYLSELGWLECDESVALWVKWRGKWQAGIKCARADWPLSTLRAKPTHERKKYFVVFFPHTKNYSWADMLLVRSINELPEPIAYKNHKIGLKMVKDLTVARRFIMKKLAIGILNILDQLHAEALIDAARDMKVWKDFAVEVSQCRGYSDLGRMLLKLQSMILQCYINSDWLQNSHQSWLKQCQVVQSAETIEFLREELFDSIVWNEVNSLRGTPVQSTLGSDWKTWKYEAMKLFLTSHATHNGGSFEQQSCDSHSTMSSEFSRKRPKLEVRRAEAHSSQAETSSPLQTMTVEIDSEFFNYREIVNVAPMPSELCKEDDLKSGAEPKESPSIVADRWPDIVVEAANSESIQAKDVDMIPVEENVTKKIANPGNRSQQCIAFIEAKGRQCVRWANDGDVYCCVHLASRFMASSARAEASPPVNTQPCEGTTVHGTRCKHRSLPGSSFCKKHRTRLDTKSSVDYPDHALKRKHEEIIPSAELAYCKDVVSLREANPCLPVNSTVVMDGITFNGRNSLIEKLEHSNRDSNGMEMVPCLGASPIGSNTPCRESPKHYSLYCEKHIPSWLKRARNGRSRIISKEVFTDLLKDCHSLEQRLHLHRACELFYKLFKSIQSLRNPVPMEIQLDWALSEASENFNVGELLLNLACTEKERLRKIWGFTADEGLNVSSSVMEESAVLPLAVDGRHDEGNCIKCKICSQDFLDEQELGNHFMDSHKKEAQLLFRGYTCAICLDSFGNKKILETHVQERHHVPFVEQCMLLQCIPCHNHFGDTEQLWLHVLSVHPAEFRLTKVAGQQNLLPVNEKEISMQKLELEHAPLNNSSENFDGISKFSCKFCGMKFDLLPDLGCHHQAAHMGPSLISSRPQKKGIRYYAYRLKSGRLTRPQFKKGLGVTTYRIKSRGSAIMKKRLQASRLPSTSELRVEPHVSKAANLGKLAESQCLAVAKKLFCEIKKTRPRPSNLDILAMARTACCNVSLKASLEAKYGVLPERLFLKAAKLCSEQNIQVEWHREGFVCSRGCRSFKDPGLYSPTMPRPDGYMVGQISTSPDPVNNNKWEMDECHYVINLHDFSKVPIHKATVLCDDISLGKESIPVACVVEDGLLDSLKAYADGSGCQVAKLSMPWESFAYVTSPILSQSHESCLESLHLRCACPPLSCSPESCDHVYLFDHDYEDAKDIYGKPMCSRFPYDDKGRIMLEEGYLVYECSDMCNCDKTCPNRVLQKGVQLKLEVFKTDNKGWAVRAGEPILRGMFVCEYIGEVLDQEAANQRRERYGEEGCSYMFSIDSHTNDMSRLIGEGHYVIDATNYGNVSRFINHSCLPNLVSHQVLINCMDPQRAHIGLYASRDIAFGEELTFNFRYELLPGDGYPCHCGTSKCRGRLN